MLVPTPSLSVEPSSTATFPARQSANSAAFCRSVLASWMNRICPAGTPASDQPGADLPVDLGAGRPRSECRGRRRRSGTRPGASGPSPGSARSVGWRGRCGPLGRRQRRSSRRQRRGDADELQVERGLAAVAANLEHVVFVRRPHPARGRPVRRGWRRRRAAPVRTPITTLWWRAAGRCTAKDSGGRRSATSPKRVSSSGTFSNFAGRRFIRKLAPSGVDLDAGLELDEGRGPGIGAVQVRALPGARAGGSAGARTSPAASWRPGCR